MAGLIEKGEGNTAPSFEDGMRAAEEAAGIPSDEELYGEMMSHPEPDEAGRVPASRAEEEVVEAPVEEAEAELAETPAEEEPAEVPQVDELAELQRKYDEMNQKVGQMANENAELRRQQELAYQQPYPYQPEPQALAWFDEIVDTNPEQAAVWAAQQQQPLLYERAARAWFDVDPVGQQRYERGMEENQRRQDLLAQIAPQIQGAQELHANAERDAAMQAVASRHDDFAQVVGSMSEDEAKTLLLQGLPEEVLPIILNGTRASAEKAFETLYAFRKAQMTPAMVQGAVEAVEQAKEDAKAAKREATVASSSTTTSAPVEEDEGQRLMRVWKEQRPSMRDAWTGRKG